MSIENSICPQCGNNLNPNDKVCVKCGFILINQTQNNVVSTDEKNAFSNNSNSVFVFNNNSKSHSSKKISLWIAIIGAIILAVISGFIGFNIGKNSVKSNEGIKKVSKESLDSKNETNNKNDIKIPESTNDIDSGTTNSNSSGEIIDSASVEDADFSYGFTDAELFSNYKPEGTYKCGVDISPGKYVVFGYYGNVWCRVYSEPSNPDGGVQKNGIMIPVDLKEGEYIAYYSGGVLIPEEEFDKDNLAQYGIFLVGEDIEPGEYKIKAITDRYQSKFASITGVAGGYEIKNDVFSDGQVSYEYLFSEQSYFTIKEGQYLILSNAALYKVD